MNNNDCEHFLLLLERTTYQVIKYEQRDKRLCIWVMGQGKEKGIEN